MLSPVKIWRNQKKVAQLLGKIGTIVSWTVVRVPPADFADLAPYPVAVVKLTGGQHVTCQLVDWEEKHLTVGQRVLLVIRQVTKPNEEGIIPYGIKAKPIQNGGESV